jgi:hypothetical protein
MDEKDIKSKLFKPKKKLDESRVGVENLKKVTSLIQDAKNGIFTIFILKNSKLYSFYS